MTLNEAIQLYLASKAGAQSPQTITWYKNRLNGLLEILGDREITTVTLDILRSWRYTISQRSPRHGNGKRLSPDTLRGHIRAVRAFFSWLCQEGYLIGNPATRLEMPERPQYIRRGIPDDDRDAILAVARQLWPNG